MRLRSWLLLILFASCAPSAAPDGSVADAGLRDVNVSDAPAPALGECPELNEGQATPTCRHLIADNEDFASLFISLPSGRVVKFLHPQKENLPLTLPTFINTQSHPLHFDFLRTVFPERYGALNFGDYASLFFLPEREFISGSIERTRDGPWHFSILEDPAIVASHVTKEQAIEVFNEINPRVIPGELEFLPTGERQQREALTWRDLPFRVAGVADYQAYNSAQGCGHLRFIDVADLDETLFGFRDILVLDDAPPDLERVVSGIITEQAQGPLSHLAVRSAARGTFNAYLKDARIAFADFEDTLVCIDISQENYDIRTATPEEAEAFWTSIRPAPVTLLEPDIVTQAIPSLTTLDTATLESRSAARAAYGAKATNLAALYQRLSDHNSYRGLMIPAHYYDRFMNEGTWQVDVGAGLQTLSFQDTLNAWLADDAFMSDPALAGSRLDALRTAMRAAPVPPDIVLTLTNAIEALYGNDTTMVRFRSSSNAEDSLGFSGAGLYDSTSVCPADTTDDDSIGPSRCDADKDNERSVERGLRKVWASAWKVSAFDERSWYQMDQSKVTMSILVNDRAKNERANVVAFSQNPLADDDDRLLLTAQLGAFDLVSPLPGVRPEILLVARDDFSIERLSQSTQSDDDVLSDDEAREIARTLVTLENSFPIDGELSMNRRVMLDTEWKVLADDALVIKQIRPFVQ